MRLRADYWYRAELMQVCAHDDNNNKLCSIQSNQIRVFNKITVFDLIIRSTYFVPVKSEEPIDFAHVCG